MPSEGGSTSQWNDPPAVLRGSKPRTWSGVPSIAISMNTLAEKVRRACGAFYRLKEGSMPAVPAAAGISGDASM